MSRYGFNVDDVEIVVGWDNPTQTFFGQTEVNGKEVVNTMLGMGQFDVQKVSLLESMIGFDIPSDIRDKMFLDKHGSPPRTDLQALVGEIYEVSKQ